MSSTLKIDSLSGELMVLGWAVRPGVHLTRVPSSFAIKSHPDVQVVDRRVDCVFASASGDLDGIPADVSLRFENERLVSAFITLDPPRFANLTGDDWYNSVDARMQFHAQWLASKCLKSELANFLWGSANVCRDKSENVYIQLHSNR